MTEKKELRSRAWFARQDKMGFYYRSWMKNRGFPQDQFDGRPVIGICNTWSELTPVQLAFPHHRRARPLGRPRGRWISARVSGHVAGRDHDAADRDAVSQPRLHGRRGIDPRQPARRRGAADGLRQDHAVAADGRGERRPADHRHLRRADAARRLPRHARRIGHQHHFHERAAARRPDHVGRIPRGRGLHAPLARSLHDHGHRLDHGLHGRGARRRHAGQRGHSGGRCAPQSARARGRAPHRRDGARGHSRSPAS